MLKPTELFKEKVTDVTNRILDTFPSFNPRFVVITDGSDKITHLKVEFKISATGMEITSLVPIDRRPTQMARFNDLTYIGRLFPEGRTYTWSTFRDKILTGIMVDPSHPNHIAIVGTTQEDTEEAIVIHTVIDVNPPQQGIEELSKLLLAIADIPSLEEDVGKKKELMEDGTNRLLADTWYAKLPDGTIHKVLLSPTFSPDGNTVNFTQNLITHVVANNWNEFAGIVTGRSYQYDFKLMSEDNPYIQVGTIAQMDMNTATGFVSVRNNDPTCAPNSVRMYFYPCKIAELEVEDLPEEKLLPLITNILKQQVFKQTYLMEDEDLYERIENHVSEVRLFDIENIAPGSKSHLDMELRIRKPDGRDRVCDILLKFDQRPVTGSSFESCFNLVFPVKDLVDRDHLPKEFIDIISEISRAAFTPSTSFVGDWLWVIPVAGATKCKWEVRFNPFVGQRSATYHVVFADYTKVTVNIVTDMIKQKTILIACNDGAASFPGEDNIDKIMNSNERSNFVSSIIELANLEARTAHYENKRNALQLRINDLIK